MIQYLLSVINTRLIRAFFLSVNIQLNVLAHSVARIKHFRGLAGCSSSGGGDGGDGGGGGGGRPLTLS